eukprot:977415-Rhodomonas_salina.1
MPSETEGQSAVVSVVEIASVVVRVCIAIISSSSSSSSSSSAPSFIIHHASSSSSSSSSSYRLLRVKTKWS